MEVLEKPLPFESISALRQANRSLMEQIDSYGEDDFPDRFLDAIEHFQLQAAATGAFLSAIDDRGEIQSLINFWQTILFNGARRPATVILAPFDGAAARARAGRAPPYKGLDAFQIEDNGSFFGRRATVRAMLDRVVVARLLAVTGLSGSGKSSVVRAGFIPRLREGEVAGSRDWLIPDPIVPGRDPIGALSQLALPGNPLPSRIAGADDFVARLDAAGGTVLVSIDQFEELFTLGATDADRALTLESLTAAASRGRYRHIVVVTMRSEYDSRVEVDPAFAELFAAGRIQIGAMSARELRLAIEQPAVQIGASFEPGLADELVQRVLGEPAGLPLLQFTLLELWKHRSAGNALTWEAYAELGGSPREILARRANQVYESFNTEQDRTFSRRIFLTLVEIGAGLEPTARRVARVDLDRVASRDSVDHVLGVWQENGLIRISPPGAITSASQVEVAHEALIRNWDLLVGWIEDHFAESRRRRVLTEQALAWRQGAHDTLLGELSLKEAESLADLDQVEIDYVAASRKKVDRANRTIRHQRWGALAAVLAGLALLAIGLYQFDRAQKASQAAAAQAKLARTEAFRADDAARKRIADQARFEREFDQQQEAFERAAVEARAAARRAASQLATALRARDAMLAAQRRIGTQTVVARSALDDLERQITAYKQALRSAEEEVKAASDTIMNAAMQTAQERPAILVAYLTPSTVPPVWRHLLEPALRNAVEENARSVALLRAGADGALSTAFMISEGIAAALVPATAKADAAGWTLDFDNQAEGDPARRFAVQGVSGQSELADISGIKLVLLRVAERNQAGDRRPPPLRLAEVTGTGRAAIRRLRPPNARIGLFSPEPGAQLYLIGFPMAPTNDQASRYILRGEAGKRVQPGFVLDATGGEVTTRQIRHDATTFPGNMGSPVIDMASGAVVGIHWGGPPASPGSAASGKFAVAFDSWLLQSDALRRFLPTEAPAAE